MKETIYKMVEIEIDDYLKVREMAIEKDDRVIDGLLKWIMHCGIQATDLVEGDEECKE